MKMFFHIGFDTRLTLDMELELEALELEDSLLDWGDDRLLEALLDELLERLLELVLEELLEELLDDFFGLISMRSTRSIIILVRREEELEELSEEEALERELLELELVDRELLELDETDVLFFRPGSRIFFSFIKTFLSSRGSSSSLRLITLMSLSAAFSPT